ncbi:MAG TPA: cellulase family glycosylhydrolase [Longimicrobiaceae bacterium]|nr:cellulase family glycosylhydrolase [Longimicrobiaceae bacterium]
MSRHPAVPRRVNTRSTLQGLAFSALGCAFLAACSGGDGGGGGNPGPVDPGTGPTATSIVAVSFTTVQGAPGYAVDDSLAVKVLDQTGAAMSGVPVTFTATGGTASPGTATTDAQGVARAAWTLGAQPGTYSASAAVSGRSMTPVTFSATAKWGTEAKVTMVSGDAQGMPPGCSLATPLTVKVNDAGGAPVAGAPVYFALKTGSATLGSRKVTTDAQGMAQTSLALGSTAGTNTVEAAIHSQAPSTVSFTATTAQAPPKGFAVVGNQIYSASCQPTRFVGIARPFLESWHRGDDRLIDPQLSREDFRGIKSWHANSVRIPINPSFWLSTAANYDPEYRALVDSTVHRAEEAGLAVILDMHFSDQGNPNRKAYTLEPLPDANHAVPFWKEVAARYKDDGNVMFEMYNEPHDVSWDAWRNGAFVQDTSGSYQGVGYQQLYDAIRGTGAENIVIANGLNWGYDLSGVKSHMLTGYNIVYGTHVYDWPEKQPGAWDAGFGYLAATAPVMIGEFGTMNCGVPYYNAVMDYADRKNISIIAWAWYAPPSDYAGRDQLICTFAALLNDWSGTPTPVGAVVKSHYARY